MTRGETVRFLVDYDLYDHNIKGMTGIFLKKDQKTGKCLIYVPKVDEWAELLPEDLKRTKPDHVPAKNKKFIDSIRLMGTSDT